MHTHACSFPQCAHTHTHTRPVLLSDCPGLPAQVKCEHYWPLDAQPCTHGQLQVTLMSEDVKENWTVRDLQLFHVSPFSPTKRSPCSVWPRNSPSRHRSFWSLYTLPAQSSSPFRWGSSRLTLCANSTSWPGQIMEFLTPQTLCWISKRCCGSGWTRAWMGVLPLYIAGECCPGSLSFGEFCPLSPGTQNPSQTCTQTHN